MKHVEIAPKHRPRPLRITISEAEILADLRYPAPVAAASTRRPAAKRR
jgi:hypothetical protein